MSGLVTINTAPRRTSRRRRNKDKTCSTTIRTPKIIAKSKLEPRAEKKIIQQPAVSKQSESIPQQSETKTVSVWAKRAQAKKIQKQQQKCEPKPTQSVRKQTTKTKINSQSQQQSQQKSALRSRRGFSARKVAYKYDPNSVDMDHKQLIRRNSKPIKQEAFPSLTEATKIKSNNKTISELQNKVVNGEKNGEKRDRNSGGYKPKRVATIYDPKSIDMTKKTSLSRQLINNNNKILSSSGNCNGGLSSRSKGFRVKRRYCENVKPLRPVSNNSGGSIRPKPKQQIKYSG